jgi:4-carboxymuconolactone decarboxylase
MKKILYLTILLAVLVSTKSVAQDFSVFPRGEKAANVHHTGDVWLNHLSGADAVFDYNVVLATFKAGAKLDWHMHHDGQQLLITEGVGYYQEKDQPIQIVREGDVVKCNPKVEHWHAAAPNSDFVYIAITGKNPTKWLNKLTDETYNSIAAPASNSKDLDKEIISMSKMKWQWMSDKNVNKLDSLFHEKAVFVHMGGSWGKEQELNVIKSGGIWYKKAAIHEVSVNIIGSTAILLNRIDLLAVVGGNEVTNPFMVTEVYVKEDRIWKLADLSFTKLLTLPPGQ